MSENKNKLINRFKIKTNNLKDSEVYEPEEPVLSEENTSVNKEVENTIDNNTFDKLRQDLLLKLNNIPVWYEYPEEKQKELVGNFIANNTGEINPSNLNDLTEKLYSYISSFGPIDDLLKNNNVSAVIINGTKSIHIEINGKILNTETKLSDIELQFLLNKLSKIFCFETFDDISFYKNNEYNVTIIGRNYCPNSINITIRKNVEFSLKTLIQKGMLNNDVFEFLKYIISPKKNLIISGGINSGKTTLLELLLNNILQTKRVYLLEKEPCIFDDSNTHVKFVSDKSAKNYKDLISYIQKSYPEYFISDTNSIDVDFSEISGKIITLRANSIENTLKTITSLYIQDGLQEKYARQKVLADYDYIIHLKKLSDGHQVIDSITEFLPGKTVSNSLKTIIKCVNGKFIIDNNAEDMTNLNKL